MSNNPFKMKGSPMKRNFGIGSPLEHKGDHNPYAKEEDFHEKYGEMADEVKDDMDDDISTQFIEKSTIKPIVHAAESTGVVIPDIISDYTPPSVPDTIRQGISDEEKFSRASMKGNRFLHHLRFQDYD